ncbi:MAG: sulfotransferase family 2 domain-containing protein [Phycisphaerales bacterium]|nr:sulfotransferase family 2 domain-containing protein [Phycisphaerales bacterium]
MPATTTESPMTDPCVQPASDRSGVLNPDVFFVHVPKTGGTSLRALLEQYHPVSQIAPSDVIGRSAKEQGVPRPQIVRTSEIDAYTCFYAHTNYADFLRDGFARVTVLRDPMKRLRSLLNHWQTWTKQEIYRGPGSQAVKDLKYSSRNMALEELLRIEESPIIRNFHNGMAKTLVSNFPIPEHVRLRGDALLGKALHNLEHRMAWVGITERFDESLIVLCDRLGYPVPRATQRLNVRKREGYSDSGAEDPAITRALEYDRVVYRRGVEILDESLAELRDRHAEQIAAGRALMGCVDDAVARRFVGLSDPARPGLVGGTMDMALRGIGWHEREGVDTKRVYRWTGPGTEATIECLIKPADGYRVELGVVSVLGKSVLENTRFTINGVEPESVELDRKLVNLSRSQPGRTVTLRFGGRPVGDDGFCRLLIETPGVCSHAEVDPSCGDRRPKGIAVCSWSIEAV